MLFRQGQGLQRHRAQDGLSDRRPGMALPQRLHADQELGFQVDHVDASVHRRTGLCGDEGYRAGGQGSGDRGGALHAADDEVGFESGAPAGGSERRPASTLGRCRNPGAAFEPVQSVSQLRGVSAVGDEERFDEQDRAFVQAFLEGADTVGLATRFAVSERTVRNRRRQVASRLRQATLGAAA